MRRATLPFCSILALSGLGLNAAIEIAAADVSLIENGRPIARIYYKAATPAGAPPDKGGAAPKSALISAVEEFNYHLHKMSGTRLEAVPVTTSDQITGSAIVLGDLAREMGAVPEKTVDSADGFRLLTRGSQLLVGGQSDEAVRNGIYEILQRLGCEWVMPGEIGEVIPRRSSVKIPDLDASFAPAFLRRGLWYRGYPDRTPAEFARYDLWLQRQRGNGGRYLPPSYQARGHYWQDFIRIHKAEFDKDPTMYALIRAADGSLVRRGPQIETTHPRVIELMTQDIRDAFVKNGWPKDHKVGFPIGPADGLGYSLSPESLLVSAGRIDPIVGELDRTDELVLLANRILENLGDEYPNVLLGFYSYSAHEDYPARYKPHPRLVQVFAPINFSRYHSILDSNSKTQAYYRSVVEQWGKLHREQGNPLAYRGYSWNLAENMMPYTKLHIWGDELPFYRNMGIEVVDVESTKMWGVTGPSDWLFMKLAWNPNQDWKTLLSEYCRAAYGDGGPAMERYFHRLARRQRDAGQEAGSFAAIHLIFDQSFVRGARQDFATAKRAARTPEEKTRVGYIESGVDFLDHYLKYFAATEKFDFAAALRRHDALLGRWKSYYAQNTDIVSNEGPQYVARFLTPFVTRAHQFSSGEYRIVERLPDSLPTLFDPNIVGSQLRYQSPEINDSHFRETRTYSTTWDAQGLTGLRTGAVWYRHRFRLPKGMDGKAIGLFLGGFEDEARVWINGELVGTSGRRFSTPAEFDLTDGINYEGENLLAIQIVRNDNANEIGLGGLLRPGFIFTGPRLAIRAPQPLEQRRVLPGGELGEIIR